MSRWRASRGTVITSLHPTAGTGSLSTHRRPSSIRSWEWCSVCAAGCNAQAGFRRPAPTSERVTNSRPHAAVAAVGGPLVQEVRGVDSAVRDAEVARVRRVEHLEAHLDVLSIRESGVL